MNELRFLRNLSSGFRPTWSHRFQISPVLNSTFIYKEMDFPKHRQALLVPAGGKAMTFLSFLYFSPFGSHSFSASRRSGVQYGKHRGIWKLCGRGSWSLEQDSLTIACSSLSSPRPG